MMISSGSLETLDAYINGFYRFTLAVLASRGLSGARWRVAQVRQPGPIVLDRWTELGLP